MKGLACAQCIDMRTLTQADLEPVSCRCGNVTGWWIEGRRGVARYTAKDRISAFGVGINNHYFLRALESRPLNWSNEDWRRLHDSSCDAPNFLFDKTARNCWVVFFKPGTVADVEWATDEELAAVGLPPNGE